MCVCVFALNTQVYLDFHIGDLFSLNFHWTIFAYVFTHFTVFALNLQQMMQCALIDAIYRDVKAQVHPAQ